jgi:hypothetical protein
MYHCKVEEKHPGGKIGQAKIGSASLAMGKELFRVKELKLEATGVLSFD